MRDLSQRALQPPCALVIRIASNESEIEKEQVTERKRRREIETEGDRQKLRRRERVGS